MKNPQIKEGLAVTFGVSIVFLVQNTFLSAYASYLLASLIIFAAIYISMKKRSKTAPSLFSESSVELFAIVSIITLIIFLTGSLASPLFFFLYFMLFLLAFIYSPITIWIFLATIILYFIPNAITSPSTNTFIKLGSLLLIGPIAYFVGHEFERRQLLAKRIEEKTNDIIQDVEVLRAGVAPNSDEDEAIEEIIEEAESLKRDSQD